MGVDEIDYKKCCIAFETDNKFLSEENDMLKIRLDASQKQCDRLRIMVKEHYQRIGELCKMKIKRSDQ